MMIHEKHIFRFSLIDFYFQISSFLFYKCFGKSANFPFFLLNFLPSRVFLTVWSFSFSFLFQKNAKSEMKQVLAGVSHTLEDNKSLPMIHQQNFSYHSRGGRENFSRAIFIRVKNFLYHLPSNTCFSMYFSCIISKLPFFHLKMCQPPHYLIISFSFSSTKKELKRVGQKSRFACFF
jgi:hypothetical protein